MDVINFDKLFHITVKAMRAFNSHPDIERDWKWLLKFIFFHGIFSIIGVILLYNIYYDLKSNDISKVCKNGILCVVYSTVTFQYSIMMCHYKTLRKIIGIIKKDYQSSKDLGEEDQNIILKYAKIAEGVTKEWFVVACVGTTLFLIKSIVLSVYSSIVEGFTIVPFYELQFPEVIERSKENMYIFFGIYFFELFYGIYASITYIAFVPLGPMFMLHACGQLEVLKGRIERLFDGRSCEEAKLELNDIVKRMQFIYIFIEDIKACFRVAYEVTLKVTTIMLPLTCYEMLEAFDLEFLTFIFGSVLFTSCPCYYSDLLMEKGEDFRRAIYECGWEREYDRGIRSTLIIMATRAQHNTAIRTLFQYLCLDALTDVFHQSYSLFNLFNAMWN